MVSIKESYLVNCNDALWEKAMEMAKKRIKTEYKRDQRLDQKKRIKKIAIGYIGEFVFEKWCNENKIDNTYLGREVTGSPDKGDFLIHNLVIDVKTQEIFYYPQDDWRCEVTSDQIKRPVEIYVFSKLYNKNKKVLYLIGWLTKEDFLRLAKFRESGIFLKGKKVHYPKYDVLINQLKNLESLKERLVGDLND
jgi:hypothetical protein